MTNYLNKLLIFSNYITINYLCENIIFKTKIRKMIQQSKQNENMKMIFTNKIIAVLKQFDKEFDEYEKFE